mmetsp:Transcript_8772/g.18202  ORF Transcript_8772/g.18202 Transcript_8772/m.18202 type:complete len:251 (-) Transcript_8772:671-1423(-)
MPPTHSVTSSPVISKCTPPGWDPISSWTSKKARSSFRMASKSRVLKPFSVLRVFPWTGSEIHKTDFPSRCTARIKPGRFFRSFSAPIRTMMVSRPGMFFGFMVLIMVSNSSGVHLSEILTPRGLLTPRQNSKWAPSSCRVRSPTQSMCAEQSYQRPVVESMRVKACSYGKSKHSCAVKKSVFVKEGEPVSTPMAFMKRRDSSTFVAKVRYLLPSSVCSTKSRFQACSLEISAYPPVEKARRILRVWALWW